MLIVGVLITLTTALILTRVRVPGGVDAARLGWMSEQWLCEYRAASHSA